MNTFKRLLVLFVAGFCMLGLNVSLVQAATVDVTINDSGFQVPGTVIKIHKGDTVRWTNTGTVVHSVTSGSSNGYENVPNGYIDSGSIAPGVAFEQTFAFHGFFGFYDKYNTAAGGAVSVDHKVFISPESSTFSVDQGFDLAFHLERYSGLHGFSQCSIVFDGVDMGNCEDVFRILNFEPENTYTAAGQGTAYILTIPPGALPPGFYSLSIKGVDSDGQAFSDTAWYTVVGLPGLGN